MKQETGNEAEIYSLKQEIERLKKIISGATSPASARYHQSPVDGLKTAKEILQSDDDFLESISEIEEALIIERMELYADQFRQYLIAERDEDRGCPCKYLDDPCHERCTCKNGGSSIGCIYCATYGSLEQRKKAAKRIVDWIKKGQLSETPSHEGKDAVSEMNDFFKWWRKEGYHWDGEMFSENTGHDDFEVYTPGELYNLYTESLKQKQP